MNYKRSFTLLEAVVSTFILLLMVVSSMELVQQSLSVTPNLKEQLIASNLAQEGVELVRNLRDTNFARNGLDPLCAPDRNICNTRNMTPQCTGASGCRVSWVNIADMGNEWDFTAPGVHTQFIDCGTDGLPGGVCPELRVDPVSGAYAYNPIWNPSKFTRTIRIDLSPFANRQTLNTPYEVGGTWTPVLQDILVTSSVTWQSRILGLRTFTLQTVLTNHLR